MAALYSSTAVAVVDFPRWFSLGFWRTMMSLMFVFAYFSIDYSANVVAFSAGATNNNQRPLFLFGANNNKKLFHFNGATRKRLALTLSSMESNNWSDERTEFEEWKEEQRRSAVITALMMVLSNNDNNSMEPLPIVELMGQTTLAMPKNNNNRQEDTIPCVVLSRSGRTASADAAAVPCLCLPLPNTNPLRLLSYAKANRPLSKTVLLRWNAALVNRDNGLFDELPWSTWTVDPQLRNRDAAGNPILPKYHLGKRDAYQRMLGKDWKGNSVSIGNLAMRAKSLIESTPPDETSAGSDDSGAILTKRILQMQIQELEMDVAEWEYQLAIAGNQQQEQDGSIPSLMAQRQACQDQLTQAQESLQALQAGSSGSATLSKPSTSALADTLQKIADWTTNKGSNAAPYRGAMGYAPMLDSEDEQEDSVYTSPFDVMREILEDQLQATVIGAALENTSLLRGTLAIGGVLVLQRKTAQKTVKLAGETVTISDEEQDYGNTGVPGGTTILVECHADEAIGMALACDVPLRVEASVWDEANLLAEPSRTTLNADDGGIHAVLPMWKLIKNEYQNMTILVEGQTPANGTSSNDVAPMAIPRTTTSLWDSMFEGSSQQQQRPPSSPLFPNDNPIQSLSQFDTMANEDKARTLLSMSNFEGKLPRPRVLREQQQQQNVPNPLDELLLPLMDESVRRQYQIRQAKREGDDELVRALQEQKSARQVALENAAAASDDEDSKKWQDEAAFLATLRADVTQDEGSYSRFLDRDEWYERQRQAQAKKLKKSQFGTLLDGIE